MSRSALLILNRRDVVWDQLYRLAATEQLKAQRVIGLVVPWSRFVANTGLVGARAFALLLQRLHGVSTRSAPGSTCAYALRANDERR
jgi:hypothetical protein